jgi:hypothetical protein
LILVTRFAKEPSFTDSVNKLALSHREAFAESIDSASGCGAGSESRGAMRSPIRQSQLLRHARLFFKTNEHFEEKEKRILRARWFA